MTAGNEYQRIYPGPPEAAQARYAAEAQQAAGLGWTVKSAFWRVTDLVVTYVHEDDRRDQRDQNRGIAVAVVLVLAFALVLLWLATH